MQVWLGLLLLPPEPALPSEGAPVTYYSVAVRAWRVKITSHHGASKEGHWQLGSIYKIPNCLLKKSPD